MSADYFLPWRIEEYDVVNAKGEIVVDFLGAQVGGDDDDAAFECMRRIVAAVNACQHIPTPHLENLADRRDRVLLPESEFCRAWRPVTPPPSSGNGTVVENLRDIERRILAALGSAQFISPHNDAWSAFVLRLETATGAICRAIEELPDQVARP